MTAFCYAETASPLGPLLLVWNGTGELCVLDFEEKRASQLVRHHHGVDLRELPVRRAPRAIDSALTAYFEGDVCALRHIPIWKGGTPFERRVWTALGAIPAGTTSTYGELAASVGNPNASRAVGRANGANPLGIVVPCHRVIGAGGALTGYAGGLGRKEWLLAHEAREAQRIKVA